MRLQGKTSSLAVLALICLFFTRPVRAETLVDTILAKYGYQAFKRAEEIRFTFSVKKIGLGPAHSWIWKPKVDSVTFVDDAYSYSRKNMGDKQKAVDRKFINDQYWLLFPLHLGMDKGTRIDIDTGLSVSPKQKEKLRRVKVTYVQADGYTPNDVYVLYAQPDGLVKEWTYHRHASKRGISWTWGDNATFGGVLISRERRGLFNISFRDILVK